jgi:hypothetical protein
VVFGKSFVVADGAAELGDDRGDFHLGQPHHRADPTAGDGDIVDNQLAPRSRIGVSAVNLQVWRVPELRLTVVFGCIGYQHEPSP